MWFFAFDFYFKSMFYESRKSNRNSWEQSKFSYYWQNLQSLRWYKGLSHSLYYALRKIIPIYITTTTISKCLFIKLLVDFECIFSNNIHKAQFSSSWHFLFYNFCFDYMFDTCSWQMRFWCNSDLFLHSCQMTNKLARSRIDTEIQFRAGDLPA